MPTVFKKNNYEIISFPGYMYIGLPVGVSINQSPTPIGDFVLTPGTKLKKIGQLRKGAQSAIYQEITMTGEGSFLQFAGTFEDLILFDAFKNNERMFAAGDLFGTFKGYGSVYVGFYEIPKDDFLMIVASSCAPRLFAKEFQIY